MLKGYAYTLEDSHFTSPDKGDTCKVPCNDSVLLEIDREMIELAEE